MRLLPPIYLLAALSTLLCATAHADDLYDPGASTYVELGRYRTSFTYADGDHEAHVGRYGLAFNEPVAGDTTFGLQGGYLTLDVDGEPPGPFLDFTGRYLGLQGRYEGTWGDYFNLSGELSYTWHDVNSSGPAATHSEITWYETWAAFGPVLRYGPWRASFGGYYQGISGTETDSSPSRRVDFNAGKSVGAYAGFSFYIDETGSIGIYGTTGARKGIKLVFRRDF